MPKSSNLVQEMTLDYPIGDIVFMSKGQSSRSQGHNVQKHIEGDRVAGVTERPRKPKIGRMEGHHTGNPRIF